MTDADKLALALKALHKIGARTSERMSTKAALECAIDEIGAISSHALVAILYPNEEK